MCSVSTCKFLNYWVKSIDHTYKVSCFESRKLGVDKQIAIFSSTALSLTLSMISSFCLGIAVKGFFFFGWGEDSLYHLTTSQVPCKGYFFRWFEKPEVYCGRRNSTSKWNTSLSLQPAHLPFQICQHHNLLGDTKSLQLITENIVFSVTVKIS